MKTFWLGGVSLEVESEDLGVCGTVSSILSLLCILLPMATGAIG